MTKLLRLRRLRPLVLFSLLFAIAGCGKKETPKKTSDEPEAVPTKAAKPEKGKDGKVHAAEFSSTPVSAERVAELEKHESLKDVQFFECNEFRSGAIEKIGALKTVASLEFIRSALTDDDVAALGKSTQASRLTLANTKVTAKGLAALKSWKKLTHLTLSGSGLDGKEIVGLNGVPLRTLEFNIVGVDFSGLAKLDSLPELTTLKLLVPGMSDDILAKLPAWKSLTHLSLTGNDVGDSGAGALTRFTGLRTLDLGRTGIGGDGLKKLHSTKIESLDLNNCPKIDNESLKQIAGISTLRRLNLVLSGVKGPGMINLATAKGLREVKVAGERVSGQHARALEAALPTCKVQRIQTSPGKLRP